MLPYTERRQGVLRRMRARLVADRIVCVRARACVCVCVSYKHLSTLPGNHSNSFLPSGALAFFASACCKPHTGYQR